jgi:hypothetical protein
MEREFSIAGNFNINNRLYSSEVLGTLIIVNYALGKENRINKFQYYLLASRMRPVLDKE